MKPSITGLGCKVKLYVFTYKKLSVPSRQYYSDIYLKLDYENYVIDIFAKEQDINN